MALIQDTYLTDKGFEIANKAANGQTSFTITKVVSSDQNINDKSKDEIKKLNNLDNEINSGQIIDTDVRSSNLTGIVTQFGNDIYTKGYEVGAIAMYAKENNSNNEFLYAVTPMVENEKVPAVDTNVFLGFQVTIYVVAGDSQRMDVSLSKGGDASVDLVEKLISNSESETQKKLDNKADKTDLSNLQTSVNNNIQPKLDNKANNSDLATLKNNINDDIQPKLNNKYDKSEVESKLNSAQNGAINQAGQYTDQKYNDLSNKNNILSQKMEDYQKPNIAPVTEVDNWNGTGWTYPYKFHAEQGKTYCLSAYFNNVSIFNGFIYSVEANGGEYNAANWNGGQSNPIPNGQSGLYKAKWIASQNGDISFGFGYNHTDKVSNICITQSDNYVPFEVAQQNKASIESEGQLTDDYQAPNLYSDSGSVLGSNEEWQFIKDNGSFKYVGGFTEEKGKTYTISVDYTTNSIESMSMGIYVGNIDYNNLNFDGNSMKRNAHQHYTFTASDSKFVGITAARWTNDLNITTGLRHIKVVEGKSDVPYKVAQRNKLWNDKITNKTNDLSNNINNVSKKVDDNYNDINNKINNGVDNAINQANQSTKQLSNDKVTDNHDGSLQVNGSKIAMHQDLTPCDLNDVVKTGTFYSTGMMYSYNHTPESQNAGFTLIVKVSSSGSDVYQKIISPSLPRPYYRMMGWNNWQNWQREATQDDIASIRRNSWRELKLSGRFSGRILCKPNFQNNTAIIYGNYVPNGEITINFGDVITLADNTYNDFKFTDLSSFNEENSVDIKSNGSKMEFFNQMNIPVTLNNGNTTLIEKKVGIEAN